jgi:voltage-gated potassium channel
MSRSLTSLVLRRADRAFQSGRIIPSMFVTMVALVVLFGVLMWLLDREDFPTLGPAMWWAVSTVTTVGYGDVVPRDPRGQVIAAGLMILGFAFLSLLTGVIASQLVSRSGGPPDRDDNLVAVLERLEHRIGELERRLPDA